MRHLVPLTSHIIATQRARCGDWDVVDDLHRRCTEKSLYQRWGRVHVRRRDWQRLLAHADCWITRSLEGQAIALMSLGRVQRHQGVVDLGIQVADGHQRQGLGSRLLRQAAEHAQADGAHTLSMYTHLTNTAMLRLLRQHGPVTERRDGPHLEMHLHLAGHASGSRTARSPSDGS
ncbi:GNAT family N-acetyltransferase [Streptomyces sp. NPDC051561]|uniref:GNAT family N-acetyltransferase n=1 Tax=Streptomyces sp. NPDC051561 TaxID=3365658 RepID=UPI00379FBC66